MNTLGSILRGIGSVIDWGLRNFLRVIVVVVILGVGGYFAFQYFGWELNIGKADIERAEVPKVGEVKYLVRTDSRIYFTDEYYHDNVTNTYILKGYWVFLDEAWVYKDAVLPLSPAFGRVEILDYDYNVKIRPL